MRKREYNRFVKVPQQYYSCSNVFPHAESYATAYIYSCMMSSVITVLDAGVEAPRRRLRFLFLFLPTRLA